MNARAPRAATAEAAYETSFVTSALTPICRAAPPPLGHHLRAAALCVEHDRDGAVVDDLDRHARPADALHDGSHRGTIAYRRRVRYVLPVLAVVLLAGCGSSKRAASRFDRAEMIRCLRAGGSSFAQAGGGVVRLDVSGE